MISSCHDRLKPLTLTPEVCPLNVRSDFIEQVHVAMSLVQEDSLLQNLEAHQVALQEYYRVFFAYLRDWVSHEQKKHAHFESVPDFRTLQDTVGSIQKRLEDNIINFSCCAMSLFYSKGTLSAYRKMYDSECQTSLKKIEWTKASSRMLRQNLSERKKLLDSTTNLAIGLRVLEGFESSHGALHDLVEKVASKKTAQNLTKSLRVVLRNGDFKKGQDMIATLDRPKGLFVGPKKELSFENSVMSLASYVETLKNNVNYLKADAELDKIFLSAQELKVVLIARLKELETTEEFLRKYWTPYIDHVMRSFSLLQEKLSVIGSFETLLTLYIQMVRGIAQPLQDMKDIREYETNILDKVQFLLNTQFKEIENIQRLNNDDIQNFHKNLGMFKDVMEKYNAQKVA